MPRPKSFDEDTVLDQAVQLFWKRGYEGTSLADLEAHLGLGRQSLYNAFGDKQTLYLKALERYRRSAEDGALAQLTAPGAGLEGIRAFFRATIATLTGPGERKACLIVNTILERGSQDADALGRCNHAQDSLERSFRRVLTQAKINGDVPESLDIEAAATLLVIQNYGLSVLSKSGATPQDMESAVEVLLAGLK